MFVFGVILVRIFPTFSRIRTEYEEMLPYSVRMRENAGKNADQNNFEYEHFLRIWNIHGEDITKIAIG